MPTPLRRVLRRGCTGYWVSCLYTFGLNEVVAPGTETVSRKQKVETRNGVRKCVRGEVLIPRPRIIMVGVTA
jgi:hypothetical protein